MFYRRRPSLLLVLLAFLGWKACRKDHSSDADWERYRQKRRLFRSKIRDAFAVWENEEQPSEPQDQP